MNAFFRRYRNILGFCLIGVLVPLLLVSVYNRPVLDDLSQPLQAHLAIQNGQGIFELCRVILVDTINSYNTWNGVFFSMFLSRIPPMLIDYRMAYIHPAFFMLLLIASVLVLCTTIGKQLKVHPFVSTAMGLLLSIMFLLLMPSITEGVFWFSGAVNYTLMFAVSLLLFAWLIKWHCTTKRSVASLFSLAALCICFFLLGGGNFTTSTVSITLYGYWLLFLLISKRKTRKIGSLLPFLFLLAGYLIAILAPGNSARMSVTPGYPLSEALFYSLRNSMVFLQGDLKFYSFLMLFLPLSISFARQTFATFNRPVLFLLGSYLVIVAGFLPPIYSMQSIGPLRIENIQFFMKCIFYVFNLTYLIGFFLQNVLPLLYRQAPSNPSSRRSLVKICSAYLVASGVLFASSLFTQSTYAPLKLNSSIPSIKAVSTLLDGQSAQYAAQYDAIVEEMRLNPNGEIVIHTEDLPWHPLFYTMIIDENPAEWNSRSYADYFGCKSIRLDQVELAD